MELKSQNTQQTHFNVLLNVGVNVKFQSSSWIWKGKIEEKKTGLLRSKKRTLLHKYPPNWFRRLIFGYATQLFIHYWLARKNTIFMIFIFQRLLFQIRAWLNFHPGSYPLKNIKPAINSSLLPKSDRFWLVTSRAIESVSMVF